MHTDYKNPVIRQLRDQQVRFAPREQKLAQVNRAETLLAELEAERTYTYEYLCYRITDYRPNQFPNVKMTGEEARHDLRRFVEDVSEAAGLSAESVQERVLTVDELSKLFNVSTKTISRWRDQGLVSRRFVIDGRHRLGFLESSVERFVAGNPDRIRRGARFSQLSDEEREEIVRRARRMAEVGATPTQVAQRLADKMGRSAETIRYTLRQFAEENPELAVFPNGAGPLSDEAKRRIFQQHRRGVSADALARDYNRTRSSVYRVINEMRGRRIMELPLDFMDNPDFRKPGFHKVALAPMPEAETAQRISRPPSGLPPYLASLYEVPLLSREQEQHLFRKFNYLKYRADKLRKKLTVRGKFDPARSTSKLLERIEKLYEQVVAVKNEIIRRNLRLVVSIAKRHVGPRDNFFELVSDGNVSLIKAAEKFDYARGNKFSTYASWAIMKNFARSIPGEQRHRERFKTSQDETFVAAPDARSDEFAQLSAQSRRQEDIGRILGRLDEREQQIIASRFGLGGSQEPLTLKQVGEEMGVTKERVRQIEARALNKLRKAAEEEKIEEPGQ